MTAFPTYSTGTVSVTNGGTVITGVGSNWTGANAKPGDDIVIGGNTVVVMDVTDATHLVIDAWPYTTVSGGGYKIIKRSPLRFVGGDAMADVSTLVAELNTDGFYVFVSSIATVPDPSYGDENQYAFQAITGKLWLKTGGAWVFVGIYKGFGVVAPWSGATAYNINDVASLGGSAYVCVLAHTNHSPPNATYWAILVAAPWQPLVSWVTATAYVATSPASLVTINGSSYVCLVNHTSGVFATDLGAGKWALVASKGDVGATGAGYGGTSTTSLLIGTGSKVFTTQAGLAYTVSNRVRAASAASGANYMEGVVTAYSGTSLTVNVTRVGGSGTKTDWNFSIAGDPGSGDLLSSNNLSDVADATTSRKNLGAVLHGQCMLQKVSSNIVLLPRNGNLLTINGISCAIPAAGVSLAPTGLTVGTLYFIYAVATAGVVTSLEASATGHAYASSAGNVGIEVKSGDETRSLVGMVRPIAGPSFADSLTQRFVRSWFNRTPLRLFATISGVFGALSVITGSKLESLIWTDELFDVQACGTVYTPTPGGTSYTFFRFNGSGTSESGFGGGNSVVANADIPLDTRVIKDGLTEGYNYSELLISPSNSSFIYSGSAPIVTARIG